MKCLLQIKVYSFVRVLNLIGFRCRLKIHLIALSPSRAKPGDQRSEHGSLYGQVDAEKCNVGGGWQMELIHLSRRRGRPLPHVALWFKVSIYHRYDPTPPWHRTKGTRWVYNAPEFTTCTTVACMGEDISAGVRQNLGPREYIWVVLIASVCHVTPQQ